MSGPAGEAALDYSNEPASERPERRGSGAPLSAGAAVLAGLGLAGAILAVVATWSPVIQIRVEDLSTPLYTTDGFARHSVALVVLGVFAALMALGGARGARPAMLALAAAGAGVLGISLLQDLPHIHDTGVWNLASNYEDVQASPGSGFWLETLAGVAMLSSGVLLLLLAGGRGPGPDRPVERAAPEADRPSV